jgi:hypothetical protein
MTTTWQAAVRRAARRRGLRLKGLELRDERGRLIEKRVDLVDLGLFLGVLREETVDEYCERRAGELAA